MEGSVMDLSGYRLEKADYDDFFLVAKDDALQQLDKAKHIVSAVDSYIGSLKTE